MNKEIEIKLFQPVFIKQVSEIFVKELSKAFSAKLGKFFLEELYFPYFFNDKKGIGFLAFEEDKVVGFILGSDNKGFYGSLLKKYPIKFLKICFIALLKNPSFLFYIFKISIISGMPLPINLNLKVAELLYMAVDSNYQRQQIGQKLLLKLEDALKKEKYNCCVVQTLIVTPQAQNFYMKQQYMKIKEGYGRIWFVKNFV